MNELPDELIMKHVRNGNLAEFAILFERYHIRMYNFMLKLTGNRTISQDLTQNLFYRMLKYRQSFRDGFSFRSWAYQMARNIHIDHCRQVIKESDRQLPVDILHENLTEEPETYVQADYELLDIALTKLNKDQKELLVLSRFQHLNYEEISVIRESSVAAIKVQMHRAMKQLRAIYFNLT
jgi:RNA polymerase sigma factor (sigma-70 family)